MRCGIFGTTGKSPILSFGRRVKTRSEKYSAFQKTQISGICLFVPAQRGTYRAIVTARRVGMRWTQSCDTCLRVDDGMAAYGEVVWSWRRDRGVYPFRPVLGRQR